MKRALRLVCRNGVYYIHYNSTNQRRSLNTKDKAQALRLLNAENEARQTPAINLELGKVYLRAKDPLLTTRTWKQAMVQMSANGKDTTKSRCWRAMQSKPSDVIRDKPICETTNEDFNAVLKRGGSATNNYLRRLHNFVLGNGWMLAAIISSKQWQKPTKKPKRAITFDEHCRIIEAEQNEERRHYYEMLWLVGAAQTDCAHLNHENINRRESVISYQRQKTGQWCHLQIGKDIEMLLEKLPKQGFLFPRIAGLCQVARAAEFNRRCRLLEIKGVSLHSYRYSWAERAFIAGYEERFAQAALGHSSSVVHHAYARRAKVVCPSLEINGSEIIPFPKQEETGEAAAQTA